MLKITSIKVTNNYVLILLSNKEKYKISEDDFFENKYKAKQQLSEKDLKQLAIISNFHNAYLKALNKLKYKDRSEWEIRHLMYEDFELNKGQVDKIINKLKRYGFIDDVRYIKEFHERSNRKYWGYNKVKSKLVDVRISSKLISEHLIYNYQQQLDLATNFLNKEVKKIKNKTQKQVKNKLYSKLQYRGFKNDVIKAAVDKIEIAYDQKLEEKLLKKDFDKAYRRYRKKAEGYELRNKVFAFLARRGFRFEDINKMLDEMENENE